MEDIETTETTETTPESDAELDTDSTTPGSPYATPKPAPATPPPAADAHVSRDNAAGSGRDLSHNGGAKKVSGSNSGARKL